MNKPSILRVVILMGMASFVSFAQAQDPDKSNASKEKPPVSASRASSEKQLQQATFGLGCFSCAEAIFEQLRGVESVNPGYSGGHAENPTYKQVTSGLSGHAEVVQVNYDPQVISYDELLEVFWKMHDPTILNSQFKESGPHYKSVIFFHSDEQRDLAKSYKQKLSKAGAFSSPIITQIKPFEAFYQAEKEHLDFYRLNPENQYCTTVIRPKLDEFKKVFADRLQTGAEAEADQP